MNKNKDPDQTWLFNYISAEMQNLGLPLELVSLPQTAFTSHRNWYQTFFLDAISNTARPPSRRNLH
jgi:hypothetical protein